MRTNLIALACIMLALLEASNCSAQKGSGNDTNIVFRNNKITLHKTTRQDSVLIEDAVTGEVKMVAAYFIYEPLHVNGLPVKKEASPYYMGMKLQKKVVDEMERILTSWALTDGKVTMNLRNVVLSQKGELAYYELDQAEISSESIRPLNNEMLAQRFINVVKSLSLKPKAQYTLLHMDLSNSWFVIKKGKASFSEGKK